jgi:dihydrofolate reductase
VINRGEDGDKFKLAETLDTEALLLGRTTYEVVAASWPSRSGEFADKVNSLPKYVVSSMLEDPVWNNSTVLQGDVVDEVSKLKLELDGEIVVHGSPQNWNLGDVAAARRDAMDDLETFEWRAVDLLWGRKP